MHMMRDSDLNLWQNQVKMIFTLIQLTDHKLRGQQGSTLWKNHEGPGIIFQGNNRIDEYGSNLCIHHYLRLAIGFQMYGFKCSMSRQSPLLGLMP